ncbi:MAG TPA: hypothetical protein VGX94_05920 [Terriglobia bacterium]|nr:hypothetical protein [Terriglobia bacterium]
MLFWAPERFCSGGKVTKSRNGSKLIKQPFISLPIMRRAQAGKNHFSDSGWLWKTPEEKTFGSKKAPHHHAMAWMFCFFPAPTMLLNTLSCALHKSTAFA